MNFLFPLKMEINTLSQTAVDPTISIGDFKKNTKFIYFDVSQLNKK